MKNFNGKILIGVTGLPGAGKSFFSKQLNEEFKKDKSLLIDADKLGHATYEIKEVKEFIKSYCVNCINDKGEINRKILGEKVFSSTQCYQKFNKFISYYIKKLLSCEIEQSRQKIIIVDAALIFEWKTEAIFNEVILVETSEENRIKSLINRGDNPYKYRLRERFLVPLDKKRDAGVYIVKNQYSEEMIKKESEIFIEYLEKKYGKLI